MLHNYKTSDLTNAIIKNIAKTKENYTAFSYGSFMIGMISVSTILIPHIGSVSAQIVGAAVGAVVFYFIQQEGEKRVDILDKELIDSVTSTLNEKNFKLEYLFTEEDLDDEENDDPPKYLH